MNTASVNVVGLEYLLFLFGLCCGTPSVGGATPPSFVNFAAPAPLGQSAGEPSIGVNWKTGNVMMQAGLETLRVSSFDDSTGTARWESVGATVTSATSLDPILFTDRSTGRTFVSQLTAGCSFTAFTDDDGTNWFQNPIGCGVASGADHQTVGGGPFAPGTSGLSAYTNAVYYAAQSGVGASCSLSRDGGITFGPGVPMYKLLECGGLHGHLKVAPDGTVYVPNAHCNGQQAVIVSTDSGTFWQVRHVPGSSTQDESDPSVGIGSGGTVYLGFQNGNGHPYAAASRDQGVSWTNLQDVGTAFGIQNCQFPAVVAGDDDRAAFAFLGTTAPGDDQSDTFTGVWHLYVAATYDGGATWTTVDATPNDPVQRGCIWLSGGSNPCRNLLDFMDVTVDRQGRILVGYADGCTGDCVPGNSNSRSAVATIARQSAGTGLFASFDPAALGIQFLNSNVIISWPMSATNLLLEQTQGLTNPDWTRSTNMPTTVNGQFQIVESAGYVTRFYRLRGQ